MKRLTISADACTETLALLVTMAWADGTLDDKEKEGVRAAASVFNLTKELRERLDQILEKPLPVDEILVESLGEKERSFAYVAAAWMADIDGNVDPKEQETLDRVADLFELSAARKAELTTLAKDLPPRKEEASWANEVVALFKAIPQRLEGDPSGAFEVAFE